CKGVVVDSVQTAQKMKGCTFVNGSLEIQIHGGGNSIIKELEASLSNIEVIRGYLKIARSYPLVSLNFLRNLTLIKGEQRDKKDYAFLVLDNQNLQELWDWENRKVNLTIAGGKVFFHFNSKLCLHKINELKKYANVKDWDDTDVSPSSNGDRVACNVVKMELEVWILSHGVVGLRWKDFRKTYTDMDFRSLLGYVIYYREAPDRNVTMYDGRDACGTDDWKINDVEANDDPDANDVVAIIPHLQPATTYAAYMRTYTTASALVGAQTPIIYFTTKPHTSYPPVNVQAHASSPEEIVIQWQSPRKPNGKVTHYIINGFQEKDSFEFISQRNYCNEPMVMSDIKKSDKEKGTVIDEIVAEEKKKYMELNSEYRECCSCSKSKTLFFQEEEAEAEIQFEDYIQNNVFQKNPKRVQRANQTDSDLQSLINPTTASIWDSSTEFFNDTFPSGRLSSTSTTTAATTTTEDTTKITSSPSPIEEGNFQYIVYNATFFAVKQLHHFTEYRIEVKACHDKPSEKPVMDDYEQCSPQAITTVRTHPLGGVDDIDISTVEIKTENFTSGVLFVKWDEPKDSNGLIVNYDIEIKLAEKSEHKRLPVCITQLEYQKEMGYRSDFLKPGNYSLRLRATSLAHTGNWTTPLYFVIPDTRGN
ncbi:insulin receptor-like, partial [Stegodyphus dumicola]|uniref:insulin receptor-like n=1 Tax=Stegodyphus dumicola TaxID=202533 RepID=UPI0015AF8D24